MPIYCINLWKKMIINSRAICTHYFMAKKKTFFVGLIKTRPTPISRVQDINNLRWLLLTHDDLKWLKTTLNDLKRPKMTEITTLTYLT